MFRKLAIVPLVFAATFTLAAAKLDKVGACDDAAVSDAMKKALSPSGYKVTLDDGNVVTVWPRAEIPTATKGRDDAAYTLAVSTFIAVIRFDKDTRDYRGNAIKAGTYTLRYEIQPSDGDHLGTSPTPDFLLAAPPAADTDPARTYNFDQMVDLSRQVTGKKHPAPFNLVPPDAREYPSVFSDNEEHTILAFKVKTGSGDMPLALVVKGTTTE